MALKKREKILALVTVPLALIAAWILFSTWWGPLKTLRDQRDDLATDVERDERRVKVARKAQERLEQWHRRSLPADLDIAASEYHGWLFRLANEAGLEKPDVNVTTSMASRRRRQGGAYRTLRFNVRARGTLEQLTEFLFRFDSADRLHRIHNATLTQPRGSDKLDLTFVVEALSLPEVETVAVDVAEGAFDAAVRVTPDLEREMVYSGKDGKLVDAAKFRLAGFRGTADFDFPQGKSLEEVKTSINEKTRATGVTASVDGDKLYLRCEADDSKGPAGQLASSELSEYREAIVKRNLFGPYKAPPREPVQGPGPPPPPKFDPCQFAHVTGIVRGFDGQPKAFVIARTTGEKFELGEGDTFDIGDVHAKVVLINRRDAEIEFDGKRWLVPLGDNLREAKPLFDESEKDEESQQQEPGQEQPEQDEPEKDEAKKEESAQEPPEQDEAEKEESAQEPPESAQEPPESAQEPPEQDEAEQEESTQEESTQEEATQEEATQEEAAQEESEQQPAQEEAKQDVPDQDAGE